MCLFKLPLVVKEESHTLHLNAFTPAESQTGRKTEKERRVRTEFHDTSSATRLTLDYLCACSGGI